MPKSAKYITKIRVSVHTSSSSNQVQHTRITARNTADRLCNSHYVIKLIITQYHDSRRRRQRDIKMQHNRTKQLLKDTSRFYYDAGFSNCNHKKMCGTQLALFLNERLLMQPGNKTWKSSHCGG